VIGHCISHQLIRPSFNLFTEKSDDVPNYMNAFLSSLQRWIEKASNGSVIKGNLPPFTLTGYFDDAQFPIPLINKNPWWEGSANLYGFDEWSLDVYLDDPSFTIGSWCSYDEAHQYFQKFIDKDVQFREERQALCSKDEKSEQPSSENNKTENDIPRSYLKTNIKKGTVPWDITENRAVLEEYERRQRGEKPKKLTDYSSGWTRLLNISVGIISDIKEGKIDVKSDVVQGKIGKELKTKEEIKRRNELDDPNNKFWTEKRRNPQRREFIQLKIRNTIDWEKFCAVQAKKK
jgi:hypothetical protein